ncbi:hypothetical protein O3M35_000556 [Rhynocoris fuscipes]|uniref:Indole-3-acetaldehyde oxidase n=1 Tax=Rhynocoris fuscipes TaxID=488301 RepID=A0AAW1DM46_9HEMI
MCLEGGCGACIVSVQYEHPTTKKPVLHAVNSCMVPIFACHGWSVTTVEGLGNKNAGYHKIQKRLAAANGTQCGYCSPGMVMNMNSLLESNPKITMAEVENSFGGNICRCTGYRPILDAFKSLASDAPQKLVAKLEDIEDMVCPKTGYRCSGKSCTEKCKSNGLNGCSSDILAKSLAFSLQDGAQWYRPLSVKEVFEIFDMIGSKTYRFIAGNTGQGVYRIKEDPEVYIDINGIPELHGYEVKADGIILGANINLTEAMELFYRLAKEQPAIYAYCKTLGDHIDLVANVPVRNTGTFGGNIYMKHENHEFPSDLFLFLEMVGTKVLIADGSGADRTCGLLEYLDLDMNKKLIVKFMLPALDNKVYITKSYKIMPRAQNAHAYVNAGFMFKVDKSNYTILEKPTIIYGGINPHFIHARKTEDYLNGKILLDNNTLKEALAILDEELKPDHIIPDATPEYRHGLAQSLFYKFILSVAPEKVSDRNRSGGTLLTRPVSSGKQEFDTDRNLWPLNKPIPKIEALLQCAGEAEYTNDIPGFPEQLWGQLVLCDRARATIQDIDASEALKMPGVVKFFSAKDIPGRNTFVAPAFFVVGDEPIFAEKTTDYAGQAVGVIIAESHNLAMKAAKKVKVRYSKTEPVMLNVREIVNKKVDKRISLQATIEPKEKKTDIKYKLKGRWDLKTQYHYTMETLTSIAVPVEDDLEVYCATQWPAGVQEAISLALNVPEHRINMRVRRLGGGYGAKITRSTHVGVVSALSAYLLHRPVRIVLNLETNMEWCGKRFPVFSDYEVGVNDQGEIQYLNANIYEDDGHITNDASVGTTFHHIKNVYNASTWNLKGYSVITDTACNSWCRAPGSTEGIALVETIMEHIANVIKKDPLEVRLANIPKEGNPIPQMIEDVKKMSDFVARSKEVEKYNQENRWKKRGITLVPMNYPFDYWGAYYGMVSIFGMDGTVAITHGGIEMGQGINTKAAQVAAHILKIDLELISVKPTTSLTSPNNTPTGGSLGSEAVCYAVMKCCEELNTRLEPVRKELGSKATWKEIINKAVANSINLNSTYMFTNRDDVKSYPIYGVAVTEVEVDILTGQYHTRRVDIIEDAGQSLSPEVDIGQVEGAFIMGLGYFTCEESVYRQDTGALLTNRTWFYKPPGVKDIPIDFRITLRKNAPNPTGVLRSKATGEPPFCLSCSVTFAIRNALESARKDSGKSDEVWFDIEPPFTAERIWLGGLTKKEMFKL